MLRGDRFRTNLSVVNSDDGSNHFWDDDHVPEVSLDYRGLFVGGSLLFGLSQLLDQTQWFAFETTVETPAGACMNNLECELITRGPEDGE